MNKEAETYAELIRQRNCVQVTNHYNLTSQMVDMIYSFLEKNPSGKVVGTSDKISFINNGVTENTFNATCISSSIDGFNLTNNYFRVINKYVPSSSSSYSGGSSSGFSSNNNNNNNNNKNNNNR